MAVADHHRNSQSDMKLFRLCTFWQSGNTTTSSSSSTQNLTHSSVGSQSNRHLEAPNSKPSPKTVSSVARSLLPPRRRLRLDPASNLYFPSTWSFLHPLWFDLFGSIRRSCCCVIRVIRLRIRVLYFIYLVAVILTTV
jgi:hypothetical protein